MFQNSDRTTAVDLQLDGDEGRSRNHSVEVGRRDRAVSLKRRRPQIIYLLFFKQESFLIVGVVKVVDNGVLIKKIVMIKIDTFCLLQ